MSLLGSLLKKTNAGQAPPSSETPPNHGMKRKLATSALHDAPEPSTSDAKGVKMTKLQPNAVQAAYMGPSLWDEVLTFNECSSLELLNADDFLLETGLLTPPKLDRPILHSTLPSTSTMTRSPPTSIASDTTSEPSISGSWSDTGVFRLSSDGGERKVNNADSFDTDVLQKLLQGCSIPNPDFDNFQADESEDDDVEEVVRDLKLQLSPAELHLATAPGEQVFNPKRRKFETEELRPMPVRRKAKKQYVPEEQKDDKYWERRRKNNVAAKRARDAQRIKVNQIMIRTSWLEKENCKLRESLALLEQEKEELKAELSRKNLVDGD